MDGYDRTTSPLQVARTAKLRAEERLREARALVNMHAQGLRHAGEMQEEALVTLAQATEHVRSLEHRSAPATEPDGMPLDPGASA